VNAIAGGNVRLIGRMGTIGRGRLMDETAGRAVGYLKKGGIWVLGVVVGVIGVLIGWQMEPLRPVAATCANPVGLRPLKAHVSLSEGLGEYPTTKSGTTFVART